jgi:hypothetical protein
MKGYTGGQTVAPGFYWSRREWEVVTISKNEAVLPGESGIAYVRIPTLAMLALAPVMGALLVMFLPFIGFVLVGREAVQRGGGQVVALFRRRAFVVHARAPRKKVAEESGIRKAS